MSPTVLLSAPYLIPTFPAYEMHFREAGIEIIIPTVLERLDENELLSYAGRIDATISGDDRYSAKVLEAMAPRLKVISKWGTGIDSIDLETAQRLGIQVFNTPDAFTEAVADSVMAYLLAFARKTPWLDREMKAGRWEKIPGKALHECTLGVVGVGRIGKAVLRRAKPFGIALLGNDIVQVGQEIILETGVRMTDLEEILEVSDFISLNCDLNSTSFHLIDKVAFSKMQDTTVLINTARGPIVVEEHLLSALQKGEISGAALDVFEKEPISVDSPLLKMDCVLLAPHNANSSPDAWLRVHLNTIHNLFLGLGLEPPSIQITE